MNQIFITEGKKKNTGALDSVLKHIKSEELDNHGILEREIEEIKLKHKSLYIAGREYSTILLKCFLRERWEHLLSVLEKRRWKTLHF